MDGAQFVRLRRVFFKAAFFDLTFSGRLASVRGTQSDYSGGKGRSASGIAVLTGASAV